MKSRSAPLKRSSPPDPSAVRLKALGLLRHRDEAYKGEREIGLLRDLEAVAKAKGIQLRVCCNREYADKFPQAQCCGAELFAPYGPIVQWQVSALKPGPSREQCRCIKTVDIGMDNTCPGGCFYYYVTTSPDLAMKNYKKHDPNDSQLR